MIMHDLYRKHAMIWKKEVFFIVRNAQSTATVTRCLSLLISHALFFSVLLQCCEVALSLNFIRTRRKDAVVYPAKHNSFRMDYADPSVGRVGRNR